MEEWRNRFEWRLILCGGAWKSCLRDVTSKQTQYLYPMVNHCLPRKLVVESTTSIFQVTAGNGGLSRPTPACQLKLFRRWVDLLGGAG